MSKDGTIKATFKENEDGSTGMNLEMHEVSAYDVANATTKLIEVLMEQTKSDWEETCQNLKLIHTMGNLDQALSATVPEEHE